MMTVCILYEDVTGKGLEHKDARGIKYLREYLRDYKKYQKEVLRCLPGCYEVLVENREERKESVDPKHIRLIKKTIKNMMDIVWRGKKEKKKKEPEPQPPPKPEPVPETTEPEPVIDTEPEVGGEEIDWEARFADGEFDLE